MYNDIAVINFPILDTNTGKQTKGAFVSILGDLFLVDIEKGIIF